MRYVRVLSCQRPFWRASAQGTSGLRASFSREVLRPQGTLQNRRLTSEGKQPLLPSLPRTVEQQNSLVLFFRFLISFFASYIGGGTSYGARQEDQLKFITRIVIKGIFGSRLKKKKLWQKVFKHAHDFLPPLSCLVALQ